MVSHLITPSLILIAASIDDLKTGKIHNWLFLTCLVVGMSVTFYLKGISGLQEGALGSGVAIALLLPLVLAGALGAGDLKIMMAFGMTTSWQTTLMVVLYSIVCGAILGIFQALLRGEGLRLFRNMVKIVKPNDSPDRETLQRIPYSIALLFGWLSHVALEMGGVFHG
ncbi:A24 family peptidase [Bdellovibrionales bacterium]|nr:A24 family peptidase [Bdellovibrionales bacterium]